MEKTPFGESRIRQSGGNGDDVLQGGQGQDISNGTGSKLGASDFDQLFGGSNADIFILGTAEKKFYQGDGFATILDFESGADKIQLNGSVEEYTFVSNKIILLGGDLIATRAQCLIFRQIWSLQTHYQTRFLFGKHLD